MLTGTGMRAVNCLDDYLFGELLEIKCNQLSRLFLQLCSEINFAIALENTEWAIPVIIFLGPLVNVKTMTISVPVEKRLKAMKMIIELLESKNTSVHYLQCPTRVHVLQEYTSTKVHTKYVYSSFRGLKQYHYIRVNDKIHNDTAVWIKFLQDLLFVTQPFMDFSTILRADKLNWYTDASGNTSLECGAIFDDRHWFYSKWNKSFIKSTDLA